jgi:hypothetical protein
MPAPLPLLLLLLLLLLPLLLPGGGPSASSAFLLHPLAAPSKVRRRRSLSADEEPALPVDLGRAITDARRNLEQGVSPGAGLATAEEQAEAAFADLLVTSIDQKGLDLSDEDMRALAEGGAMDAESTNRSSGGMLRDLGDIFNALKGGAHIVRQDDGRI